LTRRIPKLLQFIARRPGRVFVFLLTAGYLWIAFRGPQGFGALLERRGEIRQLEEENAAIARENERRREHIRRLSESPSEQDMEIRKQLKLLRPGETTFILPDAPTPADHPEPEPQP
jgi:cell division protein FtsB